MSELDYSDLFKNEDLNEILLLIKSGKVCGWWGKQSGGPYVQQFENKMKTITGLDHVKAVSNGTASIYLTLQAIGVRSGDFIFTTAYNHIGGLAPITHLGATPYFVDVDSYGNMSLPSFKKALEDAEDYPNRPSCVIITHEIGQPCQDTLKIIKKAHDNGIIVIEDCSQALGAEIDQKPVGSFGDASCYSVGGDMTKMITTGEGGVVATNTRYIADAIDNLRNHGDKLGAIYPCFNYRMSDLSALVGRITLRLLPDQLVKTHVNAQHMIQQLEDSKLWIYQEPPKHTKPSHFILPFAPNGSADTQNAVTKVYEKFGPSQPRMAVSRGYQTLLTDLSICRKYPRANLSNTYSLKDTTLWVDWHRWPHTRETMKPVVEVLTDVF